MISPKDKSGYHTKQIGQNMLQPGLSRRWTEMELSVPLFIRKCSSINTRGREKDIGPKIAFAGPTVNSGAKETHQSCPVFFLSFYK